MTATTVAVPGTGELGGPQSRTKTRGWSWARGCAKQSESDMGLRDSYSV